MKLMRKTSYRARRASQLTIAAALLAAATAAWTNPLFAQNVVRVSTVEELYAAVNDPANEGAVIDVAPGTYVLTPTDLSGDPRPNLGSLVLPPGSVLRGHNEYVDLDGDGVWDPRDPSLPDVYADPATETIVDAANLTGLTFEMNVISLGLDNGVERLTVRNNLNAGALIGVTIKPRTGGLKGVVTNCIVEGGQRGLRTHHEFESFSGLESSALFEGNISRHNSAPGFGIQIQNGGVTNSTWDVTLRNNRSYGNTAFGLFVVAIASDNSELSVDSVNNIYEQNSLGVNLVARDGDLSCPVVYFSGSNGNQLRFVSVGDAIWNNNSGTNPRGGVQARAGVRNSALGGTCSDNFLKLKLIRTRFVQGVGVENRWGTERRDLTLYGAFGNGGIFPGSGNVAKLLLRRGHSDGSPGAFVCIDSDPPAANKVIVIDFDIDDGSECNE